MPGVGSSTLRSSSESTGNRKNTTSSNSAGAISRIFLRPTVIFGATTGGSAIVLTAFDMMTPSLGSSGRALLRLPRVPALRDFIAVTAPVLHVEIDLRRFVLIRLGLRDIRRQERGGFQIDGSITGCRREIRLGLRTRRAGKELHGLGFMFR